MKWSNEHQTCDDHSPTTISELTVGNHMKNPRLSGFWTTNHIWQAAVLYAPMTEHYKMSWGKRNQSAVMLLLVKCEHHRGLNDLLSVLQLRHNEPSQRWLMWRRNLRPNRWWLNVFQFNWTIEGGYKTLCSVQGNTSHSNSHSYQLYIRRRRISFTSLVEVENICDSD